MMNVEARLEEGWAGSINRRSLHFSRTLRNLPGDVRKQPPLPPKAHHLIAIAVCYEFLRPSGQVIVLGRASVILRVPCYSVPVFSRRRYGHVYPSNILSNSFKTEPKKSVEVTWPVAQGAERPPVKIGRYSRGIVFGVSRSCAR